MTKLLITGASGLLGLNLALAAVEKGYDVTGWSNRRILKGVPFASEPVDLTCLQEIPTRIESIYPDVIIHCAALANVDQAEQEPQLAELINARAPAVIADVAARLQARLVHISTDAVFDGSKGDYTEDDTPNPLNTYARTKLAGEQAVAGTNAEAAIARVVFYGWSPSGDRGLAEFFYNNLAAGRPVTGYTDMFFTPLYVRHLAETLLEMAEFNLAGVYHVFGPDVLSKYELGARLARTFGLDERLIRPFAAAELQDRAPRSLNLSMNTSRLQKALGHTLPGVREGLAALREDYQKGLRERFAGFSA